ncbi:MAG: MerR family transcriptional regulator [Thermotogota bacterium]
MQEKEMFSVGELAKKLNISVRTVQYYDQINLLSPSSYTEGGRRLYSIEDYITLYQILSLKEMGFTLKDIKEKVIPAKDIDTIEMLIQDQEKIIENKIEHLQKTLDVVSKFKKETKNLGQVDWKKLIEILSMIRNNDDYYWTVKYFDKNSFEKIKGNFDHEKGKEFFENMKKLLKQGVILKENGISPKSEESFDFAKKWWDMVMDFTKGDQKLLNELVNMGKDVDNFGDKEFSDNFKKIGNYLNESLIYYFEKSNMDFGEGI